MFDGHKRANELIGVAKDLLRHVDTNLQSHDQASSMLLEQMRSMEKQLDMEDQDAAAQERQLAQDNRLANAHNSEFTVFDHRLKNGQKQLKLHKGYQEGIASRIANVAFKQLEYGPVGFWKGSAPHTWGESRLAYTLAFAACAAAAAFAA